MPLGNMTSVITGERRVSYEICPMLTCSACYIEICRNILGSGIFHGKNFPRVEKFPGKFYTAEG